MSERRRCQKYIARKNLQEGTAEPTLLGNFECRLLEHLLLGDISPAQFVVLTREIQATILNSLSLG